MTKSEFEKLLQRYLRGECTEEEKVKIKIWFDRIETDENVNLSEERKRQLEYFILLEIDRKIDQSDNKKAKSFKVRLNSFAIYGSIAASLIVTIFLIKNNWTINEKLVLDKKNIEEYIECKTIRQSNIKANCKRIVLENSMKVCPTHRSSVTYGDYSTKHLRSEKTLVPEPVMIETPEVARLKFIYEDTPILRVLQELGLVYNIQILIMNDKLKNYSFTGDLTAMTCKEKFDLVCQSVNSEYNIQGTKIVLAGSGCKHNL
ncbi:DUF4974 domain-containing protein [Dyadobacter sp. CY345]|uniref:DUF4974 domain-containing protein n=1 Tax=Dyadobacter sp. CY345 TaxID=2909335 RepID=UPI001F3C951C|nr:DUF4974 domain-containing protein [Dyadobacter sp. CY345]MCF2446517.1 DUF4974 domain-containing protein [Dyadobacter sp. CY345]